MIWILVSYVLVGAIVGGVAIDETPDMWRLLAFVVLWPILLVAAIAHALSS